MQTDRHISAFEAARSERVRRMLFAQRRIALRRHAQHYLARPSRLFWICRDGDIRPLAETARALRLRLRIIRDGAERRLEIRGALLAVRLMIARERHETRAAA